MKKYDSYIDSGIQWIGKIPSHWDIARLKFNSRIKTGYTPPMDNSENYSEDGMIWVKPDNLEFFNEILDSKEKVSVQGVKEQNIITKGSVLLCCIGTIGKFGIAGLDLLTNQQICGVTFIESLIPSFGKYLIYSSEEELNKHANGNVVRILNATSLGNIVYPIPTIEEQTTIANYLDQKTTQIDHLIAKKEQFIQLLEEERVAVINQAVTKGLDPNVPMKDSGIKWLGEIPEHWELWKISHAFKRIGSGTTPESGNPTYHENGTINWLNTGDLNDGEVASCNKRITEQAMIDYTSLKLFPAGSLVMAMYGATIGKTGFIKFDTTTNQACCVFCEGEIIDLKFLQYWFLAKKENIINLAIGGGQPNISQNILKEIRVNCPSISEQLSIVKYLDLKTKEIDLVKSKAYQEIELLKEYKTALISEVVTGKVDVRELL